MRIKARPFEFCGWTSNPIEWERTSGLREIEDLVGDIFGISLRRWRDVFDYNSTPWGEDAGNDIQYRPMDFYSGRGCSLWQHSSSALRFGVEDYTRMVRYVGVEEIVSSDEDWDFTRREIDLADSGDMWNCYCQEKIIYILEKVKRKGVNLKAQEKILGLGATELQLWQKGIIDHISMPFIGSKGFTEGIFSDDEDVGPFAPVELVPEEVSHARYEKEEYNTDRIELSGHGIAKLLMRREQGFAPSRGDTRSFAAIYYQRVEDLWSRGQELRGE